MTNPDDEVDIFPILLLLIFPVIPPAVTEKLDPLFEVEIEAPRGENVLWWPLTLSPHATVKPTPPL